MKCMLDTNICIYLIKKKPPQIWRHFQSYSVGEIGLSAITVAELAYGVQKSSRPQQNQNALDHFLAPLVVAAFDAQAAATYGDIRTQLEQARTPIGALDTLIAAHALSLGVTLVTNNVREFSRVPNLRVVNWVSD